jgi:hypothetical protein
MKSPKTTLSATILIDASAMHVFDCLTNWPDQSKWMVGTVVHATKQQGKGVGGELSAFTGFGAFGVTDTMRITTWDPPHQCRVTHTGRIIRGSGDFIVTSISKRQSVFTWSEYFILPFGVFGRLTWPIAKPLVRLGLQVSLKRFAHWAETKSKT